MDFEKIYKNINTSEKPVTSTADVKKQFAIQIEKLFNSSKVKAEDIKIEDFSEENTKDSISVIMMSQVFKTKEVMGALASIFSAEIQFSAEGKMDKNTARIVILADDARGEKKVGTLIYERNKWKFYMSSEHESNDVVYESDEIL